MDSPQATGRPTARRPALWVAGLGIAVLVGTAFALSFEGVHALARAGGVRDPLAYLYPLVLDGFLLVALAGAVVLRSARVWIVW